jgi:hypothetical protein
MFILKLTDSNRNQNVEPLVVAKVLSSEYGSSTKYNSESRDAVQSTALQPAVRIFGEK